MSSNRWLVVYTTRAAMMLADILVVVITWIKTFKEWNTARQLKLSLSVTTCLLRDGKSVQVIAAVLDLITGMDDKGTWFFL